MADRDAFTDTFFASEDPSWSPRRRGETQGPRVRSASGTKSSPSQGADGHPLKRQRGSCSAGILRFPHRLTNPRCEGEHRAPAGLPPILQESKNRPGPIIRGHASVPSGYGKDTCYDPHSTHVLRILSSEAWEHGCVGVRAEIGIRKALSPGFVVTGYGIRGGRHRRIARDLVPRTRIALVSRRPPILIPPSRPLNTKKPQPRNRKLKPRN